MDLKYLLVIAAWALFGFSHSFLAGHRLQPLFGRYGRIAYNIIALAMVAIPLLVLSCLPAIPLWQGSSWLRWTRILISGAVILSFIHTLKFYSISSFLGLNADKWPLTFSPWHCWVRHPWYFLILVFVWVQVMTDIGLINAICITVYLVIGSRKEEYRLLALHPHSYAEYLSIVPRLFPWRGLALDDKARERLEAIALAE